MPTFHSMILTAVATIALTLAAAPPARAQQPPPPSGATRMPNGEYLTPMQQVTQPSYVPQSVGLSGPRIIKDYQEGNPVPPGYHPERRVRKGLIAGGASLFGATYFFSLLAATASSDSSGSSRNSAAMLYVPFLGPFIQMGNSTSATGHLVLAIDGLAQIAGGVMLVTGALLPKTLLVRNDLGSVSLAPACLGNGSAGMGLVGTF